MIFNILNFFRVEILRQVYKQMVKQFETEQIMNNLEEAIITKNIREIGYCNNRGSKVIDDIHENIRNTETCKEYSESTGGKSKSL